MLRRNLLILTGFATATTLLTACGSSDDDVAAPAKNIVELAQATSDLSILVEAVVAAGLVGTLSGAGPFKYLHLQMPRLYRFWVNWA